MARHTFSCIDGHTCGNPVRLVSGGGPLLKPVNEARGRRGRMLVADIEPGQRQGREALFEEDDGIAAYRLSAGAGQTLPQPDVDHGGAYYVVLEGEVTAGERLRTIPGAVPSPGTWAKGCRFADRCALAEEACRREPVPLIHVDGERQSRCIRVREVERVQHA